MHVISAPAAGGAEVYVKDLALAMAALGHTVQVVFLNRAGDIGRDLGYESGFLADLTSGGVSYDFIGYRARKNPIVGVRRLRRLAGQFFPDVMHCHLYYAVVFASFSGVPVLYTHHSIRLSVPRLLFRLFDFWVVSYVGICYACLHVLRSVTRRNVVRIDNAVNPERILSRSEEIPERSSMPRILVVGRLSAEKNLGLILRAVELLAELEFHVVIAGEGPERQRLMDLVATLGITRKISFLGNVTNVPELMSRADIYAMSSFYEGLPITLIEATLSGLPVIVTNVGGCAEVVHEVCNGIVVDDAQPAEYAAALRRLVESVELRQRFGANARQYSSRYRLERSVKDHLGLYGVVSRSESRLPGRV